MNKIILYLLLFVSMSVSFFATLYIFNKGEKKQDFLQFCQIKTITQDLDDAQWFANASKIRPVPSTQIKRIDDDKSWLTSSFKSLPVSSGKTAGARYIISSYDEEKFANKKIIIEADICAPHSPLTQAHTMAIAYSTASVGNSGWKKVKLRPGRSQYSITYKVPPLGKKGANRDYIGILSDISGKGNSIILYGIKIFITKKR